jgi:predicted transcriptional regulator|nr:MAG TPA: helix-turn-helix domain-containing protein [Caudoviricetes sp.]
MSKAVLISIRPDWCKKILRREKTVEVRKTRPKLETPFKVYIYCTKTAEGWLRTAPVQGLQRMDGLVIGEFICYEIDTIRRMGIDNNFDYCYLSLNEFGNDDIAIEIRDIKKSRIPKSELNSYAKSAPELFAWHISDMKVYDAPRSLDEFSRFGFWGINGTGVCGNYCCENYEPPDSCMTPPTCKINGCSVYRPPQSWCYVEDFCE